MASGVSQNGFSLDPPLRGFKVPGTDVTLQLVADTDVGWVLTYAAWVFNNQIEVLDKGQCGGYDKRPIGSLGGTTSNHRSGTAMDLNYSNFPQGAYRMSESQKTAARAVVAVCEGVVRWGGDYGGGSLVDEQHFEINTTDKALIARISQKVRAGQADLSSPAVIVGGSSTGGSLNTGVVAQAPPPAIGPAAEHALIPLTRGLYVDPEWNRLTQIRVNGADLTGDVAGAITAVSMSYSATQVGQFAMTMMDTPDGSIIGTGIFRKGTTIDYNDQHLEVRGLDIRAGKGGPQLTVKGRSRVVSVLRGPEHTGRGSWGEQDVTTWVLDRCREAGAIPVVQTNLGTLTFTRNDTETTWDAMQAAAAAVSCWCYEFEQIITFGRPTWLASHQRARWWDLYWHSNTDYTPGLVEVPSFSWSADGATADSLSFSMISVDAALARPGDGVTMSGNLGEGLGDWIVTDVQVPDAITAPVVVTCVRIKDPAATANQAVAV